MTQLRDPPRVPLQRPILPDGQCSHGRHA